LATEDEINSVTSKLDMLSKNFSVAFKDKNMTECETVLRRYFRTLRNADAQAVLPDEELSHYVSVWGRSVSKLASVSPNLAFLCACAAWNICKTGEGQSPCDILIVNTVAVCINGFAYGALNEYVGHKKIMDMNEAEPHIFALGNVLMTMASHTPSPNLQDTYYDTLTKFEEIIFSVYVLPTERYRHVKKIRDFAEANGAKTNRLLRDMDSLLAEYGEFLPNGQGIILNPLEIQANDLAADHYLFTVNEAILKEMAQEDKKGGSNIIPLSKALALRAGVPAEYSSLHQKIEKSLQAGDYKAAEKRLFTLFHRLAADDEDDHGQEIPDDISTYSYFLAAADRLSSQSLTHGFHLASRCITAIEDESIFSERLQEAVYGFAVPVMANWEESDNRRLNHTKELNKAIMKRSSEFIESEQAEDIFESAAIGYREYLGTITPQQRYDELLELSVWLGNRKYPSPMMVEFVDDLMNSARDYGVFKGIPLEEDMINHLALVPSP